ncbi:MAG: J domain-containing protein [bacterium]|nr:J domain-containing protein [bacterium]
MAAIVKQWLKTELDALVNVQVSIVTHEPDLIVHTWNGVKVNIYLLNQPMKAGRMRRLLHDATIIGTGTVFIVSAHLLPKDNTRVMLDEWLQAVHTLTGERIYGYQLGKDGPELIQVHFEPVNGVNAWEVQYGPSVHIARMRFYRLSTKLRAIKGDWLIADFDNACFWKDNDYRTHREQMVRDRRRSGQTTWQQWSGFETWKNSYNGGINPPGAMKTHLDACYEALGLKSDADREMVKAAFRRLAREVHPDVSDLPKDEAEARFKVLTDAYEYIKAAQNWH